MTDTPDDPDDDALERINAIRRARGLQPIVERDPAVRAEMGRTRDALAVLLWAMRRQDPGFAAAVDIVAEDPEALAVLPDTVAIAIAGHIADPDARAAANASTLTVLLEWRARDDWQNRGVIELALWRLAGVVWVVLSDTARDVFNEALFEHLRIYAGMRL
jgi:hypothetical protein